MTQTLIVPERKPDALKKDVSVTLNRKGEYWIAIHDELGWHVEVSLAEWRTIVPMVAQMLQTLSKPD